MAKKAQNILQPTERPVVKTGAPPAKRCRSWKYRAVYNVCATLKPGEWFKWVDPPTFHRETVKRWARMLKLSEELESYNDINGDVIVRRKGGDDFIEDDDADGEVSNFAGGDDDDEDDIE